MPPTPPYKPRGRGKIERFFRSVREGMLTGRAQSTLDRLNDLAGSLWDTYEQDFLEFRYQEAIDDSPQNAPPRQNHTEDNLPF